MGKARVTPLRPVTIPRLELQAAVTSVKISDLLKIELDMEITNYYWTDSTIVLAYLNNEARRFHVYVANRVQRIKESTDKEQWHHVGTKDNPADHASRGLSAAELSNSSWFQGPPFLWEKEIEFEEKAHKVQEDDPEVKVAQVLAMSSKDHASILDRLERFSKWTLALSVVARIQQCIHKRRGQGVVRSAEEARQHAAKIMIKLVQKEHFHDEITSLSHVRKDEDDTHKAVKKESSLSRLDPFIDDEGLLRVGGRLGRSMSPEEVKHPIILPKKSHVTTLLIRHCHERVAHQGHGFTMNSIRSKGYWIIGCGAAVSAFIYKCVTCRHLRAKPREQKMADLPEDRVQAAPPFTYVGMDCFGPFHIKEGRREVKRYGALFTCLALRAIHVEVLEDMSTDAFLNCLRCFIAIRGQVRHIRCDRGSNFVGANNELLAELKKLDDGKLKETLLKSNCDFIFNAPSSSHMGGVWERQIGSVRKTLAGLLVKPENRLNTASLRTFLYEAMAIVNSRPLTVENQNDPSGPVPLTPNHLLTMKTGIVLPPPGDFVKEDAYARKRWRQVQFLADQFWKRWRLEYLQKQQERQKWLERVTWRREILFY
jgi:hypothetical protein